jgi:hypothetical protein
MAALIVFVLALAGCALVVLTGAMVAAYLFLWRGKPPRDL